MNLPRLLATLLALAATLAGCGRGAATEAPPKRNVLLLVVDTLRADHLSLYGYERPTSPNLDAWASGGVVFTQARSQASCTFPSVNSLLTSRYPVHFLGQEGGEMGIPEGIESLAETLQDAGYRTLAVSGSPIVRKSPTYFNPEGGFDRGFDVFDESCLWREAECVRRAGQQLLRKHPPEQPFFLYLHFMDPHGPYSTPRGHRRTWARQPTGLDYIDGGDPRPIAAAVNQNGVPPAELEPRHVQHLLDLYDEEIAYFDSELQILLTRLEEMLGETLVVLAADHGEHFLEHQAMKHCQTVYDVEIHTPLVMRFPGVAGGRRLAAPVQNLDIVPTVLDYLGLTPEAASYEGRSLRPLLEHDTPVHQRVVSTQRTQRGVTRSRHKLVYDLQKRDIQLFDVVRDPAEARDLASAEPRLTRELMRELRDWMREYEGDQADRSIARALEAEKRLRALGYLQ